MDGSRVRIWNQRKEDHEPDRLIDMKDTSSIVALFRGMQARGPSEVEE